jgi:flagellar hook-associated protein 3 FlgL
MGIDLAAISYTPLIVSDQLVQDLSVDQSQQAAVEQQLSTGNLVNKPSDNPAATASIMQLNASLARAQQYVSNAADGLGWLSLGNSTLNSVLSNLQTARQTVLGLSGDMLSGQQSALDGAATQLRAAEQQVLALANTTYGGQALFSGTGNVSEAYDSSGNYVGGGSAPTRTVAPGVSVAVSVTGPQVFGSGATGLLGPGGVLSTLAADVAAGTTASLQKAQTTDLANLDAAISVVSSQAAEMGADYQRMQGFSTQATNAQAALQTQLSSEDTVDVAQATTQLTEDQQAYQTGLWATAQIESHTLVSYL